MTFRRFTMTKIASIVASSAPLVVSKPIILTAIEGSTVLYLGATFVGSGASITLTELVNYTGAVIASSTSATVTYTAKFDEYLKLRQTITSPGGSVTTTSYEVGTTPINTGWDIPSPVVRDTSVYALTNVNQPGTRLHYVSYSSGVQPSEVVYYLWNGTNIIDKFGSTTGVGGVPYGTDPMNPTGPVIASKYYCAVGPTREWTEVGIRSGDFNFKAVGPTQFSFITPHRHDKPDWFLFKRGDTFNLRTDKTEYATYATSWTANACSLTIYGGATEGGRQVLGAYGPVTTDLPKIILPSDVAGSNAVFLRSGNSPLCQNILITDLEFNNRTRLTTDYYYTYFANINGSPVESKNFKVQGCRFIAMGTGDVNTGSPRGNLKAEFYRCICVDAYSGIKFGAHISAAHQGGSVQETSHVWFNQCLIARNGFANIDPSRIEDPSATWSSWNLSNTYPAGSVIRYTDNELYMCLNDIPAGTAFVSAGDEKRWDFIGTKWRQISNYAGTVARGTAWDRNLYLDGPASLSDSVVLRGPSGEQFRNGGIDISRNFFMTGYWTIASDYVIGVSDNYSCKVYDNVVEVFYQSGNHIGQGPTLTLGARNVDIKRLLVTRASPQSTTTGGFGVSLNCFGQTYEEINAIQWNRTSNNKISDSIIDAGPAPAVYVSDGLRTSTSFQQPQLPMPATVGNSFENCKFISSNAAPLTYDRRYDGPLTSDTAYNSCTTYTSRSQAATANSWTDTSRTLKTYLQSIGITVNSIDGVHEYVQNISLMHRGNWTANEKFTSKPIINHVRTGWGMPALV